MQIVNAPRIIDGATEECTLPPHNLCGLMHAAMKGFRVQTCLATTLFRGEAATSTDKSWDGADLVFQADSFCFEGKSDVGIEHQFVWRQFWHWRIPVQVPFQFSVGE